MSIQDVRNRRRYLRDKHRVLKSSLPKKRVTAECIRCGTKKDCLTRSDDAFVTNCKKCGKKMTHKIIEIHPYTGSSAVKEIMI